MGAQGIGAARAERLVLLGCGRANLVVDASALKAEGGQGGGGEAQGTAWEGGGAGVGVPGPVARIALALKVSGSSRERTRSGRPSSSTSSCGSTLRARFRRGRRVLLLRPDLQDAGRLRRPDAD